MSRIEDIKPWLRPVSGTTLEKGKQLPKLNDTFFDSDLGVLQYWSGTAWQNDRTVHFSSVGTTSGAFSIGKGSTTADTSDVVIGNYSTSNGTGRPTVIVGSNSTSHGYRNEIVGNNVTINGSYTVAIGDSTGDSSTNGSTGRATMVGYYARSYGKFATSIGSYSQASKGDAVLGYASYTTGAFYDTRIGYNTQNNAAASYCVVIGSSAKINAVAGITNTGYSITIGAHSQTLGANDSISIGSHSTNRVSQTTAINNPIIVRKDVGSANIIKDFAGTDAVIMSNNMTLTSLSSTVFSIPAGCVILPTEIGIVCNSLPAHAAATFVSPTVTVQGSQDGVTYTNISNAVITNLTANRMFEVLAPIAPYNQAFTHIKISVTSVGTALDAVTAATVAYTGRAFIKGIFLEE